MFLGLDDISIHNFILDDCTCCHINAGTLMMVKSDRNVRYNILRKNIYYLCILLVLFNNYPTVHGVEHIKRKQSCLFIYFEGCNAYFEAWNILGSDLVELTEPYMFYYTVSSGF